GGGGGEVVAAQQERSGDHGVGAGGGERGNGVLADAAVGNDRKLVSAGTGGQRPQLSDAIRRGWVHRGALGSQRRADEDHEVDVVEVRLHGVDGRIQAQREAGGTAPRPDRLQGVSDVVG